MPTLLCFGDSNTHGTPPMYNAVDHVPRYGPQVRWPGVCSAVLGPDWTLIEEGLPGRTTQHPDVLMGDHMDGRLGLRIALASHGPIDWLTIMLGTNDLHTRLQPSVAHITAGLAALLDIAAATAIQARHGGFKTLVICPPPILEQGPFAAELFGGHSVSQALAPAFQMLAKVHSAQFLDAGQHITVSPIDGVHFEANQHANLGQAVAAKLMSCDIGKD